MTVATLTRKSLGRSCVCVCSMLPQLCEKYLCLSVVLFILSLFL